MTLMDRPWGGTDVATGLMEQGRFGGQRAQPSGLDRGEGGQHEVNVGSAERTVSVAAGSILAVLGLSRRTLPGLAVGAVGGVLIYRGVTGHCHAYGALGIDTSNEGQDGAARGERISRRGVEIAQAFLINKPARELYDFWRNFENLPRIMSHLESVTVADGGRSHWVAKAPRLAGGKVEWDAEITRDEPGTVIAWRSLPGSDVDTAGEVRFQPGLGDRGTEVHVSMKYVPPGGKLGHLVASMLGENPKRVIREDLRNFKRIMEIGEIPTIIGQPHGTCTGQGERYTESERKPYFS